MLFATANCCRSCGDISGERRDNGSFVQTFSLISVIAVLTISGLRLGSACHCSCNGFILFIYSFWFIYSYIVFFHCLVIEHSVALVNYITCVLTVRALGADLDCKPFFLSLWATHAAKLIWCLLIGSATSHKLSTVHHQSTESLSISHFATQSQKICHQF